MSRKHKQRPSMNQDQNTELDQNNQSSEVSQSTEEKTNSQSDNNLIENTDTNAGKETTGVVNEGTTSSPEIKSGSIVQNTTSALGVGVDSVKEKEILNKKPVDEKTVSSFELKINKYYEEGSAFTRQLIFVLREYVQDMVPGKMNEEKKIISSQTKLWNTITRVIGTDEDFNINFKIIVMFFRNYATGALGSSYPFRCVEKMPINAIQLKTFMKLINLLIVAGAYSDKKAIKSQVSIEKSVDTLASTEDRQRVVNYFN